MKQLIFPSVILIHQAEEVGDDVGDDSNEEDSKKKKKKREATKSVEVMQSASEKKLSAANKPFQWSNIFGLDRKKKSMGLVFHPLEGADKRRKRCETKDCDEAEDYGEFLKYDRFDWSFK